ncbi:MAG: hypothetical protein P4L41_14460 [Flavipsychrobacter sp.]|nr:hypothetical protein [Flavipsychrobacter sp.]
MKQVTLKKVLKFTGITVLLLALVLCIHIYIVTRPKAPDMNTIVMARIDIKQPITEIEAQQITTWMYQQKGISHVVCNPAMDNIVFTYHAIMTDGYYVTDHFKSAFNYKNATRYIPSEKELQSGCPVAATSITYKVYSFFRHTL